MAEHKLEAKRLRRKNKEKREVRRQLCHLLSCILIPFVDFLLAYSCDLMGIVIYAYIYVLVWFLCISFNAVDVGIKNVIVSIQT